MKVYSQQALTEEITFLLKKQHEGEYWDYKQEWHIGEKNNDLIKDIVCFANAAHDHNCFIIFGANNKGHPVDMTERRRTQAEVLDMLSKLPWAAENQPDISVESIEINGHHLDILIIFNSTKTPFYFSKDIKPKTSAGIPTHVIARGIIYSRIGDKNTAWGENATPQQVEQLWRKRFYLTQPILRQFDQLLRQPDDWLQGDDMTIYHQYRSEFTLVHDEYDHGRSFHEFYTDLYADRQAYSHKYFCKYFGSTIKEFNTVSVDGGRLVIPYPKINSQSNPIQDRYYYFLQDSAEWYLLQLLYEKDNEMGDTQLEILYANIPVFKSTTEKALFTKWHALNEAFALEIKTLVAEKPCFLSGQFAQDYRNSRTIIALLGPFRNSIARDKRDYPNMG
ncbi:MAG: ATP-binding protein [Victivallaceae bacterium]